VTHDLELTATVHALIMWRHYLVGIKFKSRIDHSDLKYLFEQHTLNSMKIRWLEFLNECDFDIKKIEGRRTMLSMKST